MAVRQPREEKAGPATDLTRWRLYCQKGRQRWVYEDEGQEGKKDIREQNFIERHSLGLDTKSLLDKFPSPASTAQAIKNAMLFYSKLQAEDGHWTGDYGGPLFLMTGLIIVCHVTDTPLEEPQRVEMIRYLRNVQREDGGWGLHTAGKSTVFGTAMNYVALRLLGVPKEDPSAAQARTLLHQLGGAVGIPSWGKFWLSVLNVYNWNGVNSLLPELWLLPTWLPIQPSNWWCHCRQVYLPMGYCYAHRLCAQPTQLILELRKGYITLLRECSYKASAMQNSENLNLFEKDGNVRCDCDVTFPGEDTHEHRPVEDLTDATCTLRILRCPTTMTLFS